MRDKASGFAFCVVRKLCFLVLALCLTISLPNQGRAQAQFGEGVIGWTSPSGPGGAFGSAYEACQAQWNEFMNDGYDRFVTAVPREDNWTFADCQWTRYQYLCPEETGAGFQCGTVNPSYVQFKCQSGYTATVDGHCRIDPEVEREPCVCDENGQVNPAVGKPISLASGAKIMRVTDYETDDGEFRIERHYRSFQFGRSIEANRLPRSLPRWLPKGWNFNFGYEIQLGTFTGTPASPSAKVAVLTPDGSAYSFVLQANGTWIPDSSYGPANARTNYRLELLTPLPANLTDMKTAASSWRLTDRDDNVWTMLTMVGPNGGNYLRGWPTQRVARSGYVWNFAYRPDSSLQTITDSYGRVATFEWRQFHFSALANAPAGSKSVPQYVKSILLPDGSKLIYDDGGTLAEVLPTTGVPGRLLRVQQVASNGAVLDSSSYHYESSWFKSALTGITDHLGNRVRTYSYDLRGRAVSSAAPDGSDQYLVQYGLSGTTRTRRVVGPLGKADNYSFASISAGANIRLSQITGEASAGTAASTTLFGYGVKLYCQYYRP